MGRVSKKLIFIIICVLGYIPFGAYAESKLIIAPGMMNFDYVETDIDGTFLDGENGNIPGIYLGLDIQTSKLLTVGLAFEHYSGEVDYDGHIQSSDPAYNGLPLQSKTDQNIIAITGSLRRSFENNTPLAFYGTLTIKRWERDIQSTYVSGIDNFGNPFQNLFVSGLFEVYEWWQFTFGLAYKLSLSPKSYLDFNGGLLRTINPTMEVAGLSFSLGESLGYEAGISWMYKIMKQHSLGLRGDYTYWEFGRSNVNSGFVEPDSESKMFVFSLVYEYSY